MDGQLRAPALGTPSSWPLVCWALVEGVGDTSIQWVLIRCVHTCTPAEGLVVDTAQHTVGAHQRLPPQKAVLTKAMDAPGARGHRSLLKSLTSMYPMQPQPPSAW